MKLYLLLKKGFVELDDHFDQFFYQAFEHLIQNYSSDYLSGASKEFLSRMIQNLAYAYYIIDKCWDLDPVFDKNLYEDTLLYLKVDPKNIFIDKETETFSKHDFQKILCLNTESCSFNVWSLP